MTANDAEYRWLKCRIDRGMFSDERAVTYPADATKNWLKSVFVEESAVEGAPGETGRVRVRILQLDGRMMAVLPSALQEIVTVSPSDVSPA
jgi:hypothetical protein